VHELSIALGLVDAACEELGKLGGSARVSVLRLKVGALSGVVSEALMFSFDVAAAGSPLEGARLDIEEIPVAAFCEACGGERTLRNPHHLQCPSCGAPASTVVRGRELELVALEVIDDAPDCPGTPESAAEER